MTIKEYNPAFHVSPWAAPLLLVVPAAADVVEPPETAELPAAELPTAAGVLPAAGEPVVTAIAVYVGSLLPSCHVMVGYGGEVISPGVFEIESVRFDGISPAA